MTGIGIIGAGHFGAVHARAIAQVEGLEIVAVCREDAEAAAAFAAEHGGRVYVNWRELLADPRVDAVVIATPHHLHRDVAIGAAEAGKHILLEKPMAPSLAECDDINAAVARAGVHLMVGHVMHFALPCLKAKEIIASGAIGKPLVGSSAMVKFWMESNRRPWHLSKANGGGMLMTAGIHSLDRLVWLMGSDVVGVNALAGTFFHDQEADDTALIGLRFADGGIGQVRSVGYREGVFDYSMELQCENGALRLDFDSGIALSKGGKWVPVPDSIEPDWTHRAIIREWQALLAAIRGEAPVPVNGQYARHVVSIIDAVYRASDERREVHPR